MKTKTAEFATEIVHCVEAHAGLLRDGSEYVAVAGERYAAASEIVQRSPYFFAADGERTSPFEVPRRSDPPEPATKPRKPVKQLRARKSWRSPITSGPGAGNMMIQIRKGDVVPANRDWLAVLSPALRKELFEEV